MNPNGLQGNFLPFAANVDFFFLISSLNLFCFITRTPTHTYTHTHKGFDLSRCGPTASLLAVVEEQSMMGHRSGVVVVVVVVGVLGRDRRMTGSQVAFLK